MENSNEDTENPYKAQIEQLEIDRKRMQDEFNAQRAKMKELYLQREDELSRKKLENEKLANEITELRNELSDTKNRLLLADLEMESHVADEKRKADEEIANLQQLINDTVEESSSASSNFSIEVKKLQDHIMQLRSEKQELEHHLQENSSLAPSQVLSVLTKKVAKKLGADTFSSQDDGELNLVDSLEEEIKALKDKLRATDEELQKCKEIQSTPASQMKPACDMCSNYEAELVKEQSKFAEFQLKLLYAEKAVERHKQDLIIEIGLRKDIEEKWNEKKELHRVEVQELCDKLANYERDVEQLQCEFVAACDKMRLTLTELTNDRDVVQIELQRLQNQNDNLIGKFIKHSQELQNEVINLPDTVEELQELLLKTKEDLITSVVGKEESEEEVRNLRSELVLLKEMVEELQKQHQIFERERKQLHKLKTKEKEAEMKLIESERINVDLRKQITELKTKNSSLLHTLDTNETVQKDFVLLSQDLQVQLQKIRDADTQVRWQHEEDVDDCPVCRLSFLIPIAANKQRIKEHCRHCGQIFCSNCLPHVVPSGPNQRPSKVCDVCHTLLVKTSPPYFSNEAPHSPQ